MLFNSYIFLFAFLPLIFLLFWYGGQSLRWRLALLTIASYVFYSWWQFDSFDDFVATFRIHDWQSFRNCLWHWRFTLIMLLSSSIDYVAAALLARISPSRRSARLG